VEIQSTTELLAARYQPLQWAVDGLIPEGITVFAAPWKAGKSRVILDCLIGVTTGTDALGALRCEPGPALYLALEDTPRRAQDRMAMTRGTRPDPVELYWAYELATIDRGGLGDVAEWLDDHPDARMVVVDVLGKIRGDVRSTYQRDYELIGQFRRLSEDHGNVPIVLVTHTNKFIDRYDPTASIQGSKGLVGAADAILMMLRDRGSDVATLLMTGKDVPEQEVPLRLDGGRWVVTRSTAAHRGITGSRGKIYDALSDGIQGAGTNERPGPLATATGETPDNVRQILHRMHKAGQITKDADGRYHPVA
jgi:hypothetical protein